MEKRFSVVVLLGVLWLGSGLLAQQVTGGYPAEAERLFVLARDQWSPVELQLLNYADFGLDKASCEKRLRRACLFLQAATELDNTHEMAWHDLLELLISDTINDRGRARDALMNYSYLNPEDNLVIDNWINYSLNTINDRETREYYLQTESMNLSSIAYTYSNVLTQLGIMALEKGDMDTARMAFAQAVSASAFNEDAFTRYVALPPAEISAEKSEQLTPEELAAYAKATKDRRELFLVLRWRARIRNNPYDFEAVVNLIDTLDAFGRQKLAQEYYEYAFKLLEMQPGLQITASELRLKQLGSAYAGGLYQECLEIAAVALQDNPDDLLVNALLAKAMEKFNMTTEAQKVLEEAANAAIYRLGQPDQADGQLQSELAWFFCFIRPDRNRALQLAQAAYDSNPQESQSRGLFAYALAQNQLYNQAETILAQVDTTEPIAALAQAQVLFARQEDTAALKKLEGISGAGGILKEHIEQLLEERAPQEPTDEGALEESGDLPQQQERDLMALTLEAEFGGNDLKIIAEPEKFVRCSIRLNKDVFNYGDPMMAQIYVSNVSDIGDNDTPVLLTPESFIDPHVLITAKLKGAGMPGQSGGDKPIVVAYRYLAQQQILMPGRSNVITEPLNTGLLGNILSNHPQRNYEIEFHVYLDPIPDGTGGFTGTIAALQPEPITVTRMAFEVTQNRMDTYYRMIRSGSISDRIKTAQLFTGLLNEAELERQGKIRYPLRSIDTIGLREMIGANLKYNEFQVRAFSAYALRSQPLSAADEEAQRLAGLLTDSSWFVRFMAAEALGPVADLTEYLQLGQKIEENEVIQRQITLELGQEWEIIEMPITMPEAPPADTEAQELEEAALPGGI